MSSTSRPVALVPIKDLTQAKQRLASVLSAKERQALAQAMCEDVLGTLSEWGSKWRAESRAAWRERPAVAVVTGDPFASDLAKRFGFEVIADRDNASETGAIEMATRIVRERGATGTLVIPADIPLIEAAELQRILEAAPAAGTVLVPDAAGRGTNAAWRSPADLFPLRFGNDSFLPHRTAAQATGLPCVVLELTGIARDIDRPEDLLEVAAAGGERRSQKLVRSWNIANRMQVAHG